MRASFRDTLLLLINLLFVLGGLFILPSDRERGIVTLAFFGSCLAVTLYMRWQVWFGDPFRLRMVTVPGGVRITPKRGLLYLIGGWLAVLGIVLTVFGGGYPAPFRWLSMFMAAVGIAAFGAALFRLLPRGHMQFDPDALEIGEGRWAVRIPWPMISGVGEADYRMNRMVLIAVAGDSADLTVIPDSRRAKAEKRMAFNRNWAGASFVIMPSHYGIGADVLSGAIERYSHDETARAELRPAAALPASVTSQA